MPTAESIMAELKSKGNEKTCKIYARHGMDPKRVLGVSVADLKVVAKTMKGEQDLACALYGTGTMDAMYLAGMVANGAKLTSAELNEMVASAAGLQMISEYTIPWLAVENPRGRELALEWIASDTEHVAAAGWATYSGLLATKADGDLDLAEIERLLGVVVEKIHGAQNRVRMAMNSFVISVGTYVKPLLSQAKSAAQQMGEVSVDVGDTACKVPLATGYIEKAESRGRLGQKKKTIRC
jgi:3-methyladenine DNA glycosylase AlkD